MTNRLSLYTLILITLIAWLGLLLFTHAVPPHALLAFIIFFCVLSLAQTSTLALIAYLIGLRFITTQRYHTTIGRAVRQGALLSLVIVLNLILRALHSWNIFMAIVILGAAIVVEVLSLARK